LREHHHYEKISGKKFGSYLYCTEMINLFIESFDFLLKPGKSSFLRIPDRSPGQAQESIPLLSFLRKQESIVFDNFLDSGFHRNDIFGRNLKGLLLVKGKGTKT